MRILLLLKICLEVVKLYSFCLASIVLKGFQYVDNLAEYELEYGPRILVPEILALC